MKNIILALLAILLLIGSTSVFIVDEKEHVVVLQLGNPVRTVTEPGLNIKAPYPFQDKIVFDDRLLEYDSPPE